MKAAKQLRELMAKDSIIMAPGCHDAMGAFLFKGPVLRLVT